MKYILNSFLLRKNIIYKTVILINLHSLFPVTIISFCSRESKLSKNIYWNIYNASYNLSVTIQIAIQFYNLWMFWSCMLELKL